MKSLIRIFSLLVFWLAAFSACHAIDDPSEEKEPPPVDAPDSTITIGNPDSLDVPSNIPAFKGMNPDSTIYIEDMCTQLYFMRKDTPGFHIDLWNPPAGILVGSERNRPGLCEFVDSFYHYFSIPADGYKSYPHIELPISNFPSYAFAWDDTTKVGYLGSFCLEGNINVRLSGIIHVSSVWEPCGSLGGWFEITSLKKTNE
ncbi:MAG: hypothetical protein LBL81_05695 [Tannerella sp.]|jgi:hypothetical protein|nr:hypothetical protein [Tannerella sp.]